MKKLIGFLIILIQLFVFYGCGNNDVKKEVVPEIKTEFSWKENLGISDIPDFELRGKLSGKEVRFPYIVFEVWRGSKDNVLNFSLEKAEQKCGYIENYRGFQLISKGEPIKSGEFVKSKFEDVTGNINCVFRYINDDGTSNRYDGGWNCAMNIEKITANFVSGKIAMCFNDEMKSWIAGKFEAIVCNN